MDMLGYDGTLVEVHAHKAVAKLGLKNFRRLTNVEYNEICSNRLLRTIYSLLDLSLKLI